MGKLMFAFGNPRGRKKKKRVAKRRKKGKTKSVKSKLKLAVAASSGLKSRNSGPSKKKAVAMAKRRKPKKARKHRAHRVAKRRHGKRHNPMSYDAVDAQGRHNRGSVPTKKEFVRKVAARAAAFRKQHGGGLDYDTKNQLISVEHDMWLAHKKDVEAFKKDLKTYRGSAGYKVAVKVTNTKEKSPVAKKKKKRKIKKVAKAAKKHTKRAKSSSKRKGGKRRRRMTKAHRHAKSTRHIRRGATAKVSSKGKKGRYSFKSAFGKGKRKVKVSGSFRVGKKGLKGKVRINPYRRNPMIETYTGMKQEEITALAIGGALVPLVNGMIQKVPGGPAFVTAINGVVGPQAVGSVVPMVMGLALNAIAEHAGAGSGANKYLRLGGEGLVAAGLIGLVIGLTQNYINPMLGLSGINFTPNMRGINFTPRMGIMPRGMGIMPQLNGGMGSVGNYGDFGATGDYGGNAGYHQSRADFGADGSLESDYDTDSIDGDMHTTTMN